MRYPKKVGKRLSRKISGNEKKYSSNTVKEITPVCVIDVSRNIYHSSLFSNALIFE